jgi:hypothetical protein
MGHENISRRGEAVAGPSNRNFGFVFATVFALIAAWPLLWGRAPRWWALIIACVFLLLAVLWPAALTVPNRLWLRVGVLLHRFVSPIALGIVFFLVVTPTGLIMRLVGKDPMRLRYDRAADTYWIKREPPAPRPDGMPDQF